MAIEKINSENKYSGERAVCTRQRFEVKTPLDMYPQRHSPYRRIYGYITLAYQHAIPAGTCPDPIFPYIPYLLTYPSGLSPAALSSRRKNTGVNLK